MPRGKAGTKTGREARNRAYQQQLRDRKRVRKVRAAHYAPPPLPTIGEGHRPALKALDVPRLRELATLHGVSFTTRTRKADLIDAIIGDCG